MSWASILTIGSELLAPGKRDTNSEFLTERLGELGIAVNFRASVADHEEQIARAVLLGLERAPLVFLTGGLGPTSDDVTRDGVARALERELELDPAILRGIEARFASRGREMPAVNRRQAMRIAGSDVLENRAGTAPGLWVDSASDGHIVVLLPGPPRELRRVFDDAVAPRLRSRLDGSPQRVVHHRLSLSVVGLFESAVEEKIADLQRGVSNPVVAILASGGQVEVRLSSSGGTLAEAEEINRALSASICERLGSYVFSDSGEKLEAIVGRLLSDLGLTVAVAESLTGGLIMHRLTDVAGASGYFSEGVVTYSNESKASRLAVDPGLIAREGAVSDAVARAMAEGVRTVARASVGLAVTGIAGPSGATPRKPVGLVYVALSDGDGTVSERHLFPGDREQVKRWTSQAALDLLRRRLLGHAEA